MSMDWTRKRTWFGAIFAFYLVGVLARPYIIQWDPSVAALFSPMSGFEYSRTYYRGGLSGIRVGLTKEEALQALESNNLEGISLSAFQTKSKVAFKANPAAVARTISLPIPRDEPRAKSDLEFLLSADFWKVSLSQMGRPNSRNYLGYVYIELEFTDERVARIEVSGLWLTIQT